jgi:hypothetical protein
VFVLPFGAHVTHVAVVFVVPAKFLLFYGCDTHVMHSCIVCTMPFFSSKKKKEKKKKAEGE